jgi:hypothetical protein
VEACVQKLLEDHKDVASEHGHWKKVKEKRGITVHLRHEEVPHLPATFFLPFLLYLFIYLFIFFLEAQGNPIKAGKARGLIPGSPKLLLRILQSLDYYPRTALHSHLNLQPIT